MTAAFQVTNSLDDVTQVNGAVQEFDPAVWVGTGGSPTASYTGLRFQLDIPPGSVIASARLEVTAAQTQWLSIGVETGVEDRSAPALFSAAAPPSSRVLAPGRVSHVSNVQWVQNTRYSLGEVGALLQHVVSRADWTATSSVAFVVRGTAGTWGRKFVHSVDGNPLLSPRLVVTYVPGAPPPPPPPPPAGFTNNKVLVGFADPTSITVVPDGRLIVTERAGRVRVVLPGRTSYEAVPFLQLTNIEATVGERALINLALDPAFATNGHYYVFYTRGSPLRDTVSRFTAVGNSTDLATEVVLYQDTVASSDIHHGGGLAIGPDGALYISTGDGHDTQPGAAHASQRLTSYRGKVLRLNRDGSVPLDNPFHDGPGPNLDAIWALGLRNPFRLSFDAATGTLHAYDVGGGAWEEVNRLVPGANFGWPICEGVCAVEGMTNPSFAYPHAGRDAAIGGGVVYRGTAFPASHHGNLFYGDFVQSWIRRLVFAGDGSVAGDLPFDPPDGSSDGPTGPVVDLDVGLDGAIYYVNIGGGAVHRISYYSGNRPPTISATSAMPSGGASAPLAVQFGVEATDLDAQPLSYTWEFGDGTTSSERAPLHLYQTNGTFSARVLVSDGTATTYSDPIAIVVGSAPTVAILAPDAGTSFQAGADITLSGSATDDGPLPDSAYSWTVVFRHDTHVHPAFGPFSGPSGTFAVPTSGHDFSGDTSYEATLTVTDAQGLSASATRVLAPLKRNLTLATEPAGLSIALDAITRPAPLVHDTLVGFSHRVTAPSPQQVGSAVYEFTGWSDGGAAAHDIVAPATATTLVATYRPVPTLSVADAAILEGDIGVTVLTFIVSLSAPSTSPVSVTYASADDTASSGSDYQPVTATLTFSPGEVSGTVAVTVAGDTDPEADERLTLALSTPSGALIGDGIAVGTIGNDDVVPIVVSIGAASFIEGTGSITAASWPVALSAASPSAVSVHYTVAAGTAIAGSDFAATSGTLTFAAGATQATIAVTVTADALDEPDETIAATLDSAVNASIGVGTAVGTIVDDDAAPAIAVADGVVVEGPPGTASAVVTLTLSAPSGRVVSATAATSDQTAGSADYTATTATVTWPPGTLSQTVAVPVLGDAIDEPDETFLVTVSTPANASIADGTAAVTIADDDPAPALAVSDVTVTEGHAGSRPATFTVSLTGATSRTVTVAFATAAATATAPADFAATSGSLTFAPGIVSQTIDVPIAGDAIWEPDESFVVGLSAPANALIADPQGIGTIANDDPVPVGPITATFQIAATTDDVNEAGTDYQATQATVWLGNGGTATTSFAGLRFTGVDLPRGATIVSARLEVNAAQTQWITLQYQIAIENAATSAAFSTTARPSTRVLATPRVNHTSNVQWVTGTWYGIDGLGPLVQAVTDRADWTRLNSLSLVVRGTGTNWGRKFVRSRDAGAATAPRLIVVYHPPPS